MKNSRKRQKLDPSLWYGVDDETVKEIPYDINGLKVYHVQYTEGRREVQDGRKWKPWVTSSRKGFAGKRHVQSCKGSYICRSDDCPYKSEFGKANSVQFVNVNGKMFCRSCNRHAKYVPCIAKKVTEFPKGGFIATIYHAGNHTCTAIPKPKVDSNRDIEEMFKANQKLKPSAVPSTTITSMIRDGKSWEDIDVKAESMLDMNKIKNIKAKVVSSINPSGHNFDAVGEIKKRTDEKDKYLIWRMNNRQFNGQPSFVFKMSKEKAEICVQMDFQKSQHSLSKEFCFLDAVHSRCQGYKTLTLWVWHPTLNELVNLATMECEAETSETIQTFWTRLNEVSIMYKYFLNGR